MGRAPRAISCFLFVFWLGVSWQARVPHPDIPSNATVFSHVYTIKLAGENTEVEGASPPPQEALGPPSSSQGGGLFEHTLEGPDQEHVVFTHRINLPPQACGCSPGTEDTQEILRRLQALENEVRTLQGTCQAGGGCCPATTSTQASTGQTDIRTLCSHHGSFDLSRCICECEPGWGGPTCAEAACPGGCSGPERGKCVNGRCQCRPGYSGIRCEEPPSCPDDCNDQGRCVDGRCTCFQGYVGPSCSDPACPQGCLGHGQCVAGRCVCDPGYTGDDCGTRGCPSNCNRHGECRDGRCVCEPGFTGPACGSKACPNDCNQRGRCLKGAVCACHKGFTGPDCGQLACPEDCNGHGECENGVCLCHDGYSGDDCSIEIPSIGVRVANRDETSFRLEWKRPVVSVDGYEIHVVPTTQQDRQGGEAVRLSGTETVFERRGLKPGEEYTVTVRAEKGQRYGPPVSQIVRTRVAPPHGLRSSQVTENTVTLRWQPPSSRPDGYILSYVPLVAARPADATQRVELPAAPESVTLEGLDHSTRYRITLIARRSGDSSRATSVVVSTTAPDPNQPVRHYSTPSPSSHRKPTARKPGPTPIIPSSGPESRKPGTAPVVPSSGPEARKPGTAPIIPSSGPEDKKPGAKPHPSRTPSNTTLSAKELFLKKITQNISAKLSPYKGTLLERLESYLRATNFPLQGGRTIESVAWDIYSYLIYRKSKEIQERVKERLIQETNHSFPIGGAESVYSDGYLHPEHVKPAVVASFPDGLEVSLDGVRGVSDNVVIRYRNTGNGEEGELVVPGDASSVSITGLAPGTTYHMEIHGVVKGKSSKSYSFITTTAPALPTTAKTRTTPTPAPSPGVLLKDLLVADVSPNSLRVTWSAPPSSFHSFSLQYKDPKSSAPPGEVRVPGTERSVNVIGLNPSTEYELQLHGEKLNGDHDAPLTAKASTAPLMEKPTPPLRLGELTAGNAKPNSLDLSWTVEAGNFDSFIVQYRDAQGKAQALPVEGNLRSLHLHDLVPSHRYHINLYGVSGRKRLGPISTQAETAPAAEAEKPSLGQISISEVTDKSARLSWDVPTGAFDSFLIQYKDAEGKPKALPVDRDSREATISNLVPSRKYKFNLYGLVGRKRLGPVSTETVTASGAPEKPDKKLTAPPSLGELSASDITSDTVRLSWSVPSGGFDSFLIQYKDAEGRPQVLPMEGDTREVTIPSLAPSRRYRFNLYGIANRKRLGPATTDVTTASQEEEPVPEPVLGDLSISDATSNSVRLTWSVPTGSFDSFLLQYQDPEGNDQALPMNQDSREATIPNLAPSKRYRFNLYGISGSRYLGPVSADAATAASQETKKERPDEAISTEPSLGELSASDVTADSIRLSWTVPTGSFDSFLVQYKDSDGKLNSLPVKGGSRELTVPNLAPSRRYKFSLYGVSGRKRSSPISTEATTASQEVEEPVTVQPSLGELSPSDVTPDSVLLSWTVPTGSFDSFQIQYKDADGRPQALPVEGGSRELTVPNLAPSRRYKFNLYGVSGRKRSSPISTEATTASLEVEEPITVQPTLGELSASDVTPDSVRLSWTVPTGSFDSFQIQYKDADGRPQALPVEGASRELTVPNLAPSRRYKFSLYGVSGRKHSSPISTEATTASQVVEEPVTVQPSLGELSASDVTPDSVRLSWTVPTGSFDSFQIQYKDADGRPQALPVEGGSRELTVPNLAPSRRYKFSLYGVSGRKRSSPISTEATTASQEVEEPITVQPSLGELSASDVTPDSVHLSWTVPTGSFDSFQIQYKDADGRPQALPVEGGSRELTVPNLAPSRRYKFNLYGISGRKRSSPISTEATTASQVVEEPITVQPSLGELSASDVTPDSVRLSWTVPTGSFDSFQIQYKDADGRPQALPVEGGSRELTVPNLAPSRRYKFSLYGISGRKRSSPISTEATTASQEVEEPITVQPSLGELSASDVTPDSVHLSWTVPTGSFDSFQIQYKDADGRPQALPVDGASREVTVPNLAPSRRYKFSLYGISGRKRSSPISTEATTASWEVEEPDTVQPTLGELSASDVTPDSIRLSWTVPTGSFDSFQIQYKDADGRPQALPVEGGSRELTVPNLAPSRRYKFSLYGVSGRKRFSPISTEATTASQEVEEPITVQPSLGELLASDVTPDSVRLSWTVPTGSFDSFQIQYKDADGRPQALPVEGGSRELTVPNLAPSRRYKFSLYGISGRKRSSPISTETTTASREEPVIVQPSLGEFSASDVTPDSIRLSWTVPTGSFDSFLVQYKDADGRPQALPMEGGSRELTVPNLAPSRRYKFNLYGVSGRKRSSPISTEATTASREEPVIVQPSLGEFSASDVTPDSIRLSWTVPTGSFDSFLVQYKDADGRPQALPMEGGSRELTVPNLAPSRRYKFNLYGVSGRKRSSPISTEATTASRVVEEPVTVQPSLGELSASDVTPDSVRLSWTVPTGSFDSFQIQYKDADGRPQALPVEGGSRELTVPNLAPSRRYKFSLYGVSGRKRSSPISTEATTAATATSAEVTTERMSTIQLSLEQLLVSDLTSTSARLSWAVPTGDFDSFLVQYEDAHGTLQELPVDGVSRTIAIPDLEPNQRYQFNLYGVYDGKRYGPLSVEAVTAPAPVSPKEVLAPQPSLGELSAFDISSNSLRLSWTVPTGSFDSFLVEYRDAEGRPQTLPVEGGSREVTISSLVPSRRYKFNLFGVSGHKRLGPLSTDAVTVPAPLMEKPTPPLRLGELTAGNAKPNSLDLSWTVEAGNFDSFIVQYRDAQGKAQALPVEGNLRSLHLHDLVPSHRYHINLYGVSGRKRLGPISTQAETAPSPTAPPAQPSLGELSVSDVTSDSVRLSWTVPAGSFDSFQIQYKDAEGKPQALPVEGGSREVTIPNLAPSRRYKFNLYGLSGRKRLGPVSSDAITASPVQEPPTPPALGALSVSDVTTNSVRLTWSVLTGRFDTFLVQYKDAEGKPQAVPVEGDFREILIPNLAPSRRYKFNLYGLSGRKRLGPVSTDAITAAPPAETRSPPSLEQLSVSDVASDSAHLTWTIRAGTFDSFVVQYKDAEGKTQALPLDGSIYETTVTGLSPSRRYKFNLYGLVGRKRLGPVSADTVTASATEKEDPVKPSLGELSASDVTPDSVRLSWTVPTGSFDSFQIQYKDAEGKPQALPVDGASREVTVPNLAPSRRYKFNLFGVSGQKRLGPISSEATTAAEEEESGRSKPSLGELSVSEAGSDSVRLSWSVPAGRFDSFLVQYKGGEEEPQTLPVDGGSREVTVPNLTPSQRYQFNLYGISGGEYVGPVSTDAFTAPSTPEQDVEEKGTATPASEPNLGELSVSDVTSDSIRLSWSVPPGTVDSFLVQYKDAENRLQSLPVDKETNWVVIYYLMPSYRYKFNLYGISGRKRFGPASVSIATVTAENEDRHIVREDQEVPPGMEPRLGELSVSDVTSNAARLSWSVPSGSFDSFSVQYKDAEGRPQALPVGGGSREVIVPHLAPSHKYKFNLYGISGQRRLGPISANAVTTASTDPGVQQEVGERAGQEIPSGTEPRLGELSVSDVTSNAARLSWSVPAGSFDSFSVQYKDAEGRPQALPVGGGSREVIVPHLAPSHKYKFNLYGISGQRRLGPISANAVTTAAKTPGKTTEEEDPEEMPEESVQPRVGDVTVSEITPDSLLLSWSIQEGSFDSFLIQYKDATGKLQTLPVDGAMRSLHLYNLTPSQRYKFNIFGVSGYKRLGPVSIDAVTAPEASQEQVPVQPRLGDLSVSTVTSDSVSLSWSVPAGSFHSFLVQFKDAEDRPQVLPLNGDSRDVTVPGLKPSHRYKFNLYGISGHKRLGPVSTDAVTAPGTHPEGKAQLKLGELSAHNVTSESLLLSWTIETGNFNSFIIQYRGADGKPHALPVDGSLRSLRLHDLHPSHRYKFNLYGVSGRKRLGPVSTEATTAAAEHVAPPQPNLGELSASDINATSVRLSWTVQAGDFDSFIIQYRDAEGKPQALPRDASSRDVIISKLAPSRKYKFNLYGISGRKRFGPISTEAVTARIVAPEIGPTLGDLSISEVTKESVRLSWTISAGKFDSFLILYKDTEGNTQTVPVDADSRMVVISGLEHSHRYKFNLYGISGRKRLGPISTDAVTAFPDAPSKPAALLDHLVVSEVTPITLQLTWEATEGGFDSFLVRYKDPLQGSGRIPPPAKEVKVPGDETTATLRGLTPNTEYSLTLYGIKDGSEAANINTAARTSGLELDSPRDLRFSDIRETSVVANWRAPSSRIDRYKVSFQPSDGGEPRSISVDGSKLKTTIDNLTPGASYEVTVMSIRGFEESKPLVGYVTTVPDGPSDLRAINVTNSSAVLTWHPPVAEMNNYIVTYGPIGGPRVSESVPGNRVQLRLSELRLDTEYRASIYGEKEGNRSSPVSATFTTGADGPRDLQATEVSPRSARLTWSPPRAPPGGYLLSYETPYGQSKEIPLDVSITSYELQNLIPSSRYQVQVQALRRGTPTAPTSTSFTTGHLAYPFPRDCSEESQNGPGPSRITTIYLGGNRDRPLQVYCDMETDGGGWIVFQRRMNGETDFWRDWEDYAKGFGDLSREFWLGNDALHQLTTSGDYELRVDLRAKNESVYATYQHFRVDPPADYYRLHLGSYSGTAGDAFGYHSGSVFSTRDRDPNRLIIPCAVSYRGAWWYRNCHYTNLNGLYSSSRDHQGVSWFNWKGFEFSIPFTEMKLRPRGFQPLRRA